MTWRYETRYLIAAPAMLVLYVQYALVYQAWNRGGWWLAWFWVPFGLLFAVQNIIFNATFGTFLFLERPRQWFFSDRLRALDDARKERFRVLLNAHDKDHI